ncbi:LOW QUALITY PROTEIN: hypothetical protein PHMEG_00033705 [Phytophthora megakarya]|uniref:GAG-pre-integrase domain-containing protein n=1 Tax=Phytophthora megakarya TaxID=4795 RepID=A0A225USL4_9STRA|nr:LOW QUALITY PROTEIN: hypothetical protein PHMEG_00033705 [Phytophthora megakarya]
MEPPVMSSVTSGITGTIALLTVMRPGRNWYVIELRDCPGRYRYYRDLHWVKLRPEDVLYIPSSEINVISQYKLRQQGFTVPYDGEHSVYTVSKSNVMVLKVAEDNSGLFTFVAKNRFLSDHGTISADNTPHGVVVNYSAADGVADLQLWHERLGQTNAQYLKLMMDRELGDGMMLKQRTFDDCAACHLGKQGERTPWTMLERNIKQKNEVIYVDLYFPEKNYCSRFTSILTVMDGYTRHLTAYPLRNKSGSEEKAYIKRYVHWAERQMGKKFPVRHIFSDRGEFGNEEIVA